MSEPRILLSAGETSGDSHGSALARALNESFPQARLLGLAGPRMVEAGVEPIVEFDRLLVMGFVEVITRLPFFLRLRRKVRRLLDRSPPDLVIPIDYPGFNLWLTREAHRRGIAVLYYIAPQVWAWKPGRVRILAEAADRVAVAFPQEEPYLREFGVQADFVGHPLVDVSAGWPDRDTAISRLGADPGRPLLALLPGSRPQEVDRHLGPFLEVARLVQGRAPEVQVVVSRAPHVPDALYRPADGVRQTEDAGVLLSAATAALTKSGTSTVEATLRGTPLVIAHRVHPLTYLLARRLIKVESIGMVNLLAKEPFVPEFVQDLPAERIAEELLPLLEPGNATREAMVAGLGRVRERLGAPGAAKRVARIATELIGGPRDGE